MFAILQELESEYLSTGLSLAIEKRIGKLAMAPDQRIALLSNFTIDTLKPQVIAALARAGLVGECYVAPYGQYFQEILTPDSGLSEFDPDIVVLTLTLQELAPELFYGYAAMTVSDREGRMAELVDHVGQWLDEASQRIRGIFLVSNFVPPPFPQLGIADNREAKTEIGFYQELNESLRLRVLQHQRSFLLDAFQVCLRVGWRTSYDPKFYYLARIPWAGDFIPALSDEIARFSLAAMGRCKKCLVCDLDNTLWGGILGEDGVSGIKVGAGDPVSEIFRDFQFRLKALKQRGIILAACSKNNLDDVIEVFTSRPEMPLRLEDFAAYRINWEPKHQNLIEIAEELNIGLDSIVFIDDNPVEVGLVAEMLPEVTSLLLPESKETIPGFLDRLPLFEKLFVIEADRNKTRQYHENRERVRLENSTSNLEDYLTSLNTQVLLRRVKHDDLERVHQLFSKTNQFNLTTKRYTLDEISEFFDKSEYEFFCFSVKDRFGDLGIVGLLLLDSEDDQIEIDSFVLSCRAMGRSVETAVLNWLKGYCFDTKKISRITAACIPTKKNIPVQQLYQTQGFEVAASETERTTFYLDADAARTMPCTWINLITEV